MSRTLGIIDLGSNSVRLTVVRVAAGGAYRVLAEAKNAVRLAGAIGPDGAISAAGVQKALDTLAGFRRIGRSHGVSTYLAVATAAARQAENGPAVIRQISEATGIDFRVISEQEEAELAYLGALNTLAETDGVLMDLGGASFELVRFAGRRITAATSLPHGAVNLTARFLPGGHGTPAAYARLNSFLSETLATVPFLPSCRSLPLIGVGGTVRNLARMARRVFGYPLEVVHNYRLRPAMVMELYTRLRVLAPEERAKLPGLSADRADIIAGGAAVVVQILAATGAGELVVSGAGVREGLLYRHLLGPSEPLVTDVLAHSVANLLHTYDLDELRSQETTRLALALFDGLSGAPDPSARRCLTAAAALADLGNVVNVYGQDQHTFYLMTRGRLHGLSHREMAIAGAAAGFKGSGKARALLDGLKGLLQENDDEVVRRLGVLTAMARDLTRYEPQAVRAVTIALQTAGKVRLLLDGAGSLTAELQAVQGWAQDFKKAFGAELRAERL